MYPYTKEPRPPPQGTVCDLTREAASKHIPPPHVSVTCTTPSHINSLNSSFLSTEQRQSLAIPWDFGEAMTLIENCCCGLELRAGQLQKPVQETRSVNNEPLLKEGDNQRKETGNKGPRRLWQTGWVSFKSPDPVVPVPSHLSRGGGWIGERISLRSLDLNFWQSPDSILPPLVLGLQACVPPAPYPQV